MKLTNISKLIHSITHQPFVGRLAVCALGAVVPLAACEDDSDGTTRAATGGDGNAATGGSKNGDPDSSGAAGAAGFGGEPVAEPKALYALATQHMDASSQPTSYVLLTDSLKRDLSVDDAVIEVPGRGIASGPVGGGQLFVASDQSAELTRYELRGDRLQKTGTISFLPQGVTSFSGYSAQFQFIDEDKAYWFSRIAERIVIFDPTEFVIRGSIPLTGLNREGHTTSFTGAPVQKGNTLYSFVSWDVRGTEVTVPEVSAVVVVDTVSDTAELVVDERCGYARDGVIVGDWLYVVTEALGSAVRYLNEANAGQPCLLRFDTKTRTFDQSFKVELNSLADGRATGSLLVTGSGNALVHVLDEDEAAPLVPSPINNPRVLASSDLWRPARLTLGDEPSLELLDRPLTSASVLPFELGDGLRVSTTFGETKHIYEITDEGLMPTDRVDGTVPGTVFSIVQLR